jgi:hypothetical protein
VTTSIAPFIVGYWGKAQPPSDFGPRWHPLAFNGLDVAVTGAVLLDKRPRLLDALAVAAGLPDETARQWFLLALSPLLGNLPTVSSAKCQSVGGTTSMAQRLLQAGAAEGLYWAPPTMADDSEGCNDRLLNLRTKR